MRALSMVAIVLGWSWVIGGAAVLAFGLWHFDESNHGVPAPIIMAIPASLFCIIGLACLWAGGKLRARIRQR
jgi:hypothetical protein